MNTFQISCFLAVAEHLNFARAAEQLHVTQPAVTQQIHSLEKELGVSLFARTTRSVRLTQEGRLFLQDARQQVPPQRADGLAAEGELLALEAEHGPEQEG